jgi:hypothetical protein
LDLLSHDPSHHHSCDLTRRRAITERHDGVEIELVRAIQAAGGFAKRQLGLEDGKVPDIVCNGLPGMERETALDVSVVHQLTPSFLSQIGPKSKRDTLSQLKIRENQKTSKYKAQCVQEGCVFIPFVLDSYGQLAPQALQFLKSLSAASSALWQTPELEFMAVWSRRIVRALHIGNAKAAVEGIRHCRRPQPE